MKLTPLDIHHKEFRRALRGYSEEDVDLFLDEVAEEFERLFKENIDLKEQVGKVQSKVKQYEGIEETLQKTLFTAQKSAEDVTARAGKEAEQIIKDAEAKARETLQGILKEREQVQKSFDELKKGEKDFREKFRSLLESFLTMVNEIEGRTKEEHGVAEKRIVKEKPKFADDQAEGELARLLEEIKMAKNKVDKEARAKGATKGETDPETEAEEQTEENREMSESRRDNPGPGKDSEAEVKEIS